MVKPANIKVAVLDLNGNHVRAGGNIPVLRRSASGTLFQPCNTVIKASEMIAPVPVALDELSTLRHASVHEVQVVRAAKKNRSSALKKRVRFEVSCGKNCSLDDYTSTPLKVSLIVKDVKPQTCTDEEESHRCVTRGLLTSRGSDFAITEETVKFGKS